MFIGWEFGVNNNKLFISSMGKSLTFEQFEKHLREKINDEKTGNMNDFIKEVKKELKKNK